MAKSQSDTISFAPAEQAPIKSNGIVNNGITAMKVPERESRIFILSNDKRQGKVHLDVEEDVIDPLTNSPRRMRLLRGAKSVWFDEQPPGVYPEKYVAKNVLDLEFEKGICIIPINKPLMIQAAELTNRNLATKKKNGSMARPKDIYFYEWNPIELNKVAMDEENDVIKAMSMAMNAPIDEMIAHSSYLAIPTADEMGVVLDEEALRTAYIKKAKNEAKKFLQSAQSPVVKIAHMVRVAIANGKIDLGKQPGTAYWTDGGFISALPEGRDEAEYLIEYAMSYGETNTEFLNQLRIFTS